MEYKLELDVCDPFLPVEQLIKTRLEIRKFVAKYKKITSPVYFTEIMHFDTDTDIRFLWLACGDSINELYYRMLYKMDETKEFKKITNHLFIIQQNGLLLN